MSPEKVREGFEKLWYDLRRTGVLERSAAFYKDFGIENQLGLNPQQGQIFKSYFAGYVALRGLNAPVFLVSFINTSLQGSNIRRVPLMGKAVVLLETVVRVNNEIGDELIEAAQNQELEQPGLTPPSILRNAAEIFSAIYLDSQVQKAQKIETIKQEIARMNQGRNRLG